MNRCGYCGHKERRCSCERNGRRTINKMKGSMILDAHLVGSRLLLHIIRKEKTSYLQINLKSKEKAHPITEGSYRDLVKNGEVCSEFTGSVIESLYCYTSDPICAVFVLGSKKYGSYFKLTDELSSITFDEVSSLLKNETIANF